MIASLQPYFLYSSCLNIPLFDFKARAILMSHCMHIRLGRKEVNFGSSLTAAGVCYMGSKDEDLVKYFGKKICSPMANLI